MLDILSNMIRHSVAQAPMPAWNGAIRFGIELAALTGIAAGGWTAGRGPWRWFLAIGFVIAFAALWGTFRVPGDPGDAAVAVSGGVRLLIESIVLGAGAVGLFLGFNRSVGIAYLVVLAFHYATSVDRLRWLLER